MTRPLVIVGCGGHGREALGIVRAVNAVGNPAWRVLGFVDDRPSAKNLALLTRLDAPYLGPVAWLADAPAGTHVLIGIGSSQVRRDVDRRIREYGLPAASVVHPAATVGDDLRAGEGLLVFAGARVTTNVTLGRHVHLNQNSTVGHDCVVEDFVTVSPLAAVSGACRIESGVFIGTTASVLQQRKVGLDATVGAGACVVRDVAPGAVVKGVPAR